jgi:hypothetical protein
VNEALAARSSARQQVEVTHLSGALSVPVLEQKTPPVAELAGGVDTRSQVSVLKDLKLTHIA